jgi:hypothetical protein
MAICGCKERQVCQLKKTGNQEKSVPCFLPSSFNNFCRSQMTRRRSIHDLPWSEWLKRKNGFWRTCITPKSAWAFLGKSLFLTQFFKREDWVVTQFEMGNDWKETPFNPNETSDGLNKTPFVVNGVRNVADLTPFVVNGVRKAANKTPFVTNGVRKMANETPLTAEGVKSRGLAFEFILAWPLLTQKSLPAYKFVTKPAWPFPHAIVRKLA